MMLTLLMFQREMKFPIILVLPGLNTTSQFWSPITSYLPSSHHFVPISTPFFPSPFTSPILCYFLLPLPLLSSPLNSHPLPPLKFTNFTNFAFSSINRRDWLLWIQQSSVGLLSRNWRASASNFCTTPSNMALISLSSSLLSYN